MNNRKLIKSRNTSKGNLPSQSSANLYPLGVPNIGFGSDDLRMTLAVSGWHTARNGCHGPIQNVNIFAPVFFIISISAWAFESVSVNCHHIIQ